MSTDTILSEALLQEDSVSRDQALTDDSFIVEAPAGAGKTELLTQRFLKLLTKIDAPEEVVAITFTNKAASEMKSRIMDSLAMAATGEPPPEAHKQITYRLGQAVLTRSNERQWHLLHTPSRLRIYTIDSLSANLARQMPLLSRFGTQPNVRDDANIYYEEAAIRAIEHLDHADYGTIIHHALHYFDNDTYQLTQLLAEMLAKRDQWLSYTQSQHTAQDAERALSNMINADIQTAANILSPRYQQALMPIARFAASNLDAAHPIAQLLDWDTLICAESGQLAQWQAITHLLLTTEDKFRKRADKNMGLPPTAEAKPYKEALSDIIESLVETSGAEAAIARLRTLPTPQQDEHTWQMIATLAQLLHIAVGELWLVFQAHGEVDFVEISQRALLALEDVSGNTTDLALKLDYRIQHLLIDEFQDTSPSQIKLIQALTRGWQPDDGRTLFCVGDPMQSIYRFRKANVGLFLRVAQQGIGNIKLKPLKLWRNNRSTPPIVAWINHAFNLIFPSQDSISRGAIQYRPFVATKDSETSAGVTVHAIVDAKQTINNIENTDENDEEDASLLPPEIRQLEADMIIDIIQQTRADQPTAKIAVLVRARNHLSALVTAIRRNHPTLNFQAVEIEALANRQIVQDLLSLTHALHQRADRVHWLAILRAPWCGLTLADLHALVGDDKTSTVMQLMEDEARVNKLSADGQQRLLHTRAVLLQALQHQGRMPISRWLHGVWLMLGGADCLWDTGDVRDAQAFFARMHTLESAGQFSPQQLTIEVEKLYAAPDAKADDSLQLMTIHKSKGLEFDTVILPGLDRQTNGNEKPLLLWEEVSSDQTQNNSQDVDLVVAPYLPKGNLSPTVNAATPYDYLKMLEKERAEHENKRVLYVATTRAKHHLHLIGAAKVDKKGSITAPKNTFLDILWPIVHSQFHAEQAIKATIPVQNHASAHPDLTAITLENFKPKLIRLKRTIVPSIFTQTKASVNTNNHHKIDDSSTLDTDVGILTHLYLQLIADSGVENWSQSRLATLNNPMHRWFKQKAYDGHTIAQAVARVQDLLATTIASEHGQWVLQSRPSAASELAIEFSNEESATKNIIDRTFIEDGIRWIIDYKSIALAANTSESNLKAIAAQYQKQLNDYAALFKSQGLPIQKAIFFVSIGKLLCL
jgi:ATP-dependent exoDNAse (exonuclease V) beta subunit